MKQLQNLKRKTIKWLAVLLVFLISHLGACSMRSGEMNQIQEQQLELVLLLPGGLRVSLRLPIRLLEQQLQQGSSPERQTPSFNRTPT
jgi:hypothetical protein